MVDLKAFRKANKLGQNELADYLGISAVFVSHIENGRSKLPDYIAERLTNNDRGWVVPDGTAVAEPVPTYGQTAQNWPAIVADLSAKIGEQNAQIDRLLSIVEQLTKGGAK
jgi:transcriptional regulator with XRE-family HTH domain